MIVCASLDREEPWADSVIICCNFGIMLNAFHKLFLCNIAKLLTSVYFYRESDLKFDPLGKR